MCRDVQQEYIDTSQDIRTQSDDSVCLSLFYVYLCSIQISATLSQFLESPKTAPENTQKLIYEFADNVITILWCLSWAVLIFVCTARS